MSFFRSFVLLSLTVSFRFSVITCSKKTDSLFFPEKVFYVGLVEETEPPVYVGQFEAIDGDNGEIEYFLEEPLEFYKRFEMDSETGVITLKSKLDREREGGQFYLTLFARDRKNPSREASCELRVQLLDVNEYPPEFAAFDAPSSIKISETVNVTAVVGTFLAIDGDNWDEVLTY